MYVYNLWTFFKLRLYHGANLKVFLCVYVTLLLEWRVYVELYICYK